MPLAIDFSLLQCDVEFGPGFGNTVWFQYPGCPPFHRYFGVGRFPRRPTSDGYQFEGILVLVAMDRLDRLYDAMSNHEKMDLHAAEEEARLLCGVRGITRQGLKIRHLDRCGCDCHK